MNLRVCVPSTFVLCAAVALLGDSASAQTLGLPGGQSAGPALIATTAELLASVKGGTGATSLAKGIRVAHAGDDRVSMDVIKRTRPEEGPVVHLKVTEIYQILSGGGMFQSGGTLLDGKPMLDAKGNPSNEESIGPSLRGTKVSGAKIQHVVVGDAVVIPPGTPHNFTTLDGEVTYLVTRYNPGWYKDHPE